MYVLDIELGYNIPHNFDYVGFVLPHNFDYGARQFFLTSLVMNIT